MICVLNIVAQFFFNVSMCCIRINMKEQYLVVSDSRACLDNVEGSLFKLSNLLALKLVIDSFHTGKRLMSYA